MPLQLALVFHFNQHTNEYADVADRACYRGLLNVLRAHPKLKFNIHISGTLLRALNWFDPETINLIRAGVAEGQFELLGSTYAQNVPYACDDWDNAQQIALHREVLEQVFGVKPTVFWNSERSWRQSLVNVFAGGGYTHTLVEDHILQAAGLTDPVPVSTTYNDQSLITIYDDNVLRERFNYAVWFGRRKQLFDYLKSIARRRGSKEFLLAYAEDAEAMGLWNWEQGYLPQAAWANLDALLREFEQSRAFVFRHLASAQPRQTLGPLPDGAAQWMNAALLDPKAPYHEAGYRDWFDFLHRSPKLNYFRRLYSVMRSYLNRGDESPSGESADPAGVAPAQPTPAARQFHRQAVETFCHHQYEFGCIGVGGRQYWGWENVRATYLFVRVAHVAQNPYPRHWIEDINGDGSDEQVLCDGRYLVVLTAHGGRLLYWFDLIEGRQLAGNPLAVPPTPYVSGATEQPRLIPAPKTWLPETFEADLRPWRSLRTKEKTPTRLGHRLPGWIFEREPRELTVYRKRTRRSGQRLPLRAQVGALNDVIVDDRGEEYAPDLFFDYRLEPDGPCYLNHYLPDLAIEKRVRQNAEGLAAHYTFVNRAQDERRLRLKSSHELNPDYREVLSGGRAALDFYMHEGLYPGVVNAVTKQAIALEPSMEWTRLEQTVNLLALEVWLTFELTLPARGEKTLEIKLNLCRAVAE